MISPTDLLKARVRARFEFGDFRRPGKTGSVSQAEGVTSTATQLLLPSGRRVARYGPRRGRLKTCGKWPTRNVGRLPFSEKLEEVIQEIGDTTGGEVLK